MILENWEMADTAGKQKKGFWFRKIWVKANQLLITFAYHSSPLVYIYFMSRFHILQRWYWKFDYSMLFFFIFCQQTAT